MYGWWYQRLRYDDKDSDHDDGGNDYDDDDYDAHNSHYDWVVDIDDTDEDKDVRDDYIVDDYFDYVNDGVNNNDCVDN